MEIMEKIIEKHNAVLETGHLIVCRNCGEIAAQILYSAPFYKQEPPPKAESLNVAALDAAIRESLTQNGHPDDHKVNFDGTDVLPGCRLEPLPPPKEVRGEEVNPETGVRDEPKPKRMSELEQQILALLFMEPGLSGKEIIERTGGKQSTVYSILRKIKEKTGQIEPQKAAPKLSVVPDPEPAQVDYIEWLETYGGRWGETQS